VQEMWKKGLQVVLPVGVEDAMSRVRRRFEFVKEWASEALS